MGQFRYDALSLKYTLQIALASGMKRVTETRINYAAVCSYKPSQC